MNIGNYPNYSGNPFDRPDDKIKKGSDQPPSEDGKISKPSDNDNNGKEVTQTPTERSESAGSSAGKSAGEGNATGQEDQTTPTTTSNGEIKIISSDKKSPSMSFAAAQIKKKVDEEEIKKLNPAQTKKELDPAEIKKMLAAVNARKQIKLQSVAAQTTEIGKEKQLESDKQQFQAAKKQAQAAEDQTQITEKQTQASEKQTQSSGNQVLIKETDFSKIAAYVAKIKSTEDVLLSIDTHNLLKNVHTWAFDNTGTAIKIDQSEIESYKHSLFYVHVDKDKGIARPVLNKNNPHHKAIINDPSKLNNVANYHGVKIHPPIILDDADFAAFMRLMTMVYLNKVHVVKEEHKESKETKESEPTPHRNLDVETHHKKGKKEKVKEEVLPRVTNDQKLANEQIGKRKKEEAIIAKKKDDIYHKNLQEKNIADIRDAQDPTQDHNPTDFPDSPPDLTSG